MRKKKTHIYKKKRKFFIVVFLSYYTYFFSFQGSASNESSTMTEISDVDVYFKRLYSKNLNPPPISVDEFLDIMAKCKDSTIPKERVSKHTLKKKTIQYLFKNENNISFFSLLLFLLQEVFQNGIKNLFEEYRFYPQYPERELLLTAQLFGGLFERGLFQSQALVAAFRVILEGLKKPIGSNLWSFAITALDRCKSR